MQSNIVALFDLKLYIDKYSIATTLSEKKQTTKQ